MASRLAFVGAPVRWWARQSLRARITLIATALFSLAVVTGGVLVVELQRYALVRVLDSSAQSSASDVARALRDGTPDRPDHRRRDDGAGRGRERPRRRPGRSAPTSARRC